MKKVHINPLILIIYNFFAPLCMMSQPLFYTRPFFLLVSSLFLLLEGKWKRLLKFYLALIILYAIFYYSYFLPKGQLKTFSYSTMVVWMSFVPVLMCASILIFDDTPSEIISSLEKLHLPKTFIIALTITIRYIPTFQKEFKVMKEAMQLRGLDYSYKHPFKRFEYFIVPQLFRSMLVAEELTAAGLTKGIKAPIKRTSFIDTSVKAHDYILLILYTTGMIYGFTL